MVSNQEIKKKIETNGEISPENELKLACPQCGAENSDNSKFCYKCGKQLLEDINSNLNEFKHSEERILGFITTNNFNRWTNTAMPGTKQDYRKIFFTTNRVVIIETIQFATSIVFSGIMGALPSIKHGKEAIRIANELSKRAPSEIFSSNMPCLSIPYSRIKEITVKKNRRLGWIIISGGVMKITTDEDVIKYNFNSIPNGIGAWNLVHPDLRFIEDIQPILKDKLFIR